MAIMTKAPDFYGFYQNQPPPFTGWSQWYTGAVAAAYLSDQGVNYRQPAFRADMPLPSVAVSSAYIELTFMNVWNRHVTGQLSSVRVRVQLFDGDVAQGAVGLGSQEFTVTGDPATMSPVTHRFTFSGLSATVGSLSWIVEVLDQGGELDVSNVSTSTTYTAPSLTMTIAPSTVYVGDNVTLDFANRLGETLTVTFMYSDTLLHTVTAAADEIVVSCPASWFETAAFTGSNMRVNVRAEGSAGRYDTGTFSLVQPQGSAATPIAPRSTRLDGTQAINFSWSVSDTWGAQARADLQWSTDNAVWHDLATVSGNGTTWTAPALSFPGGTVYWRVRAVNEFGVVGAWSSGVSWTVYYDAVSQVEPVDTPTSGVINASVARAFSVVLTASGAVYVPFTIASATLHWRSGTSGAYTDVAMTPDGSRASCVIPAGTFPSGTIQWYAEATDNTGRTTLTDTYTLSTLSASVEAIPLAPVNTLESGNGVIVFRWDYGSVTGDPQGAVQIQTSLNGTTWTDLATITGASPRSYETPINTFSAGVIYWQARAKTAYSDYGPWSAAVSFVCFMAPVVQGVLVDSAPWATVTWQTEGQLAYEIEIDGESYGPYFGADTRAYTLREPLEDGLHVCRVRAENKYGLWSEWAEAAFETINTGAQALTLTVEADVDAALSWTGGSSAAPPRITLQPSDVSTVNHEYNSFAVAAEGAGLSYQWYKLDPGASAWESLGADGNQQILWYYFETRAMDGTQFKCVVSNTAGSVTSDAAAWHYTGSNPDVPAIILQPETVRKTAGTVTFTCAASGGAGYQWYHRVIHESGSEDDLGVTDGVDRWRILHGEGESGDIGVTDGTDVWHIPAGAGAEGDLDVEDGYGGEWYMTAGGGGVSEWEAIDGENTPVLSFPASRARDGEQFYCNTFNGNGQADSNVVQYLYAEEPAPELRGHYYVYRDGELIARRETPAYTDRTALGTHIYRVLNRLDNNMYEYSNAVTVTITVDTLMIAPLAGGEWLRLCLSDKANREFQFERSGQVAYIHYSGAKYPEAEVGEQEDLTGTFDVSWMAEDMANAKAFMALLRKAVVVKAPNEVVLEGILQGFRRYDPTFYLRYEFTVRQMDWRELDDA